jgi:hypothetical protein
MTILDRFSLAGKVALVTGASSGLGAGFAVALAQAGTTARHPSGSMTSVGTASEDWPSFSTSRRASLAGPARLPTRWRSPRARR